MVYIKIIKNQTPFKSWHPSPQQKLRKKWLEPYELCSSGQVPVALQSGRDGSGLGHVRKIQWKVFKHLTVFFMLESLMIIFHPCRLIFLTVCRLYKMLERRDGLQKCAGRCLTIESFLKGHFTWTKTGAKSSSKMIQDLNKTYKMEWQETKSRLYSDSI